MRRMSICPEQLHLDGHESKSLYTYPVEEETCRRLGLAAHQFFEGQPVQIDEVIVE